MKSLTLPATLICGHDAAASYFSILRQYLQKQSTYKQMLVKKYLKKYLVFK